MSASSNGKRRKSAETFPEPAEGAQVTAGGVPNARVVIRGLMATFGDHLNKRIGTADARASAELGLAIAAVGRHAGAINAAAAADVSDEGDSDDPGEGETPCNCPRRR